MLIIFFSKNVGYVNFSEFFFFLWIQTISFKRLGLTLGESGQVGLEFEVILSK